MAYSSQSFTAALGAGYNIISCAICPVLRSVSTTGTPVRNVSVRGVYAYSLIVIVAAWSPDAASVLPASPRVIRATATIAIVLIMTPSSPSGLDTQFPRLHGPHVPFAAPLLYTRRVGRKVPHQPSTGQGWATAERTPSPSSIRHRDAEFRSAPQMHDLPAAVRIER